MWVACGLQEETGENRPPAGLTGSGHSHTVLPVLIECEGRCLHSAVVWILGVPPCFVVLQAVFFDKVTNTAQLRTAFLTLDAWNIFTLTVLQYSMLIKSLP